MFQVTLKRPTYITPGDTVTFFVEVTPTASSAETVGSQARVSAPIPDLELTAIHLEMKASTALRVVEGTDKFQHTFEGPVFATVETSKDADNGHLAKWLAEDLKAHFDSQDEPIPTNQEVSTGAPSMNLMRTVTLRDSIPPRLSPSFATYNMLRSERCSIILQFKCADQTRSVVCVFLPVTVVPRNPTHTDAEDDWRPYKLEAEHSLVAESDVGLGDVADIGNNVVGLANNIASPACPNVACVVS